MHVTIKEKLVAAGGRLFFDYRLSSATVDGLQVKSAPFKPTPKSHYQEDTMALKFVHRDGSKSKSQCVQ